MLYSVKHNLLKSSCPNRKGCLHLCFLVALEDSSSSEHQRNFLGDGDVLCASVVPTNRMWVLSSRPAANVAEELNVCYI